MLPLSCTHTHAYPLRNTHFIRLILAQSCLHIHSHTHPRCATRIRSVPKNAYEFERALQLVRGRPPAELAALLDSLSTRDGGDAQFGLGALVATALDADFLAELIGALSEVYLPQVRCQCGI